MANFNDPICRCNNGMNSTSFYAYFVIAENSKRIINNLNNFPATFFVNYIQFSVASNEDMYTVCIPC